MTKDEIIRMAREAGFTPQRDERVFTEMLERFAALVAERDAEIVHAEYECESLSKQITTIRAAAQQALEWFEWFHGDKTQGAATGTDVHDALTAAMK